MASEGRGLPPESAPHQLWDQSLGLLERGLLHCKAEAGTLITQALQQIRDNKWKEPKEYQSWKKEAAVITNKKAENFPKRPAFLGENGVGAGCLHSGLARLCAPEPGAN